MSLFVLTCHDIKNGLEMRMSTRQQHLDYLAGFSDALKLAGPLLETAEGSPNGSMLILDMATVEDVKHFADNDPYALAGLFATTTITPFRATIGSL
jgi:uncharacterized protein